MIYAALVFISLFCHLKQMNSTLADISCQLTILERCVAEMVCKEDVIEIDKFELRKSIEDIQNSDFVEKIDTAHTLLSSDPNYDISTVIEDINIRSQMYRNVRIANKIIIQNDIAVFKKHIIKCILRDLDTEYVNTDIALEDLLENDSPPSPKCEVTKDFYELPSYSVLQIPCQFSGLYLAISELILLIE